MENKVQIEEVIDITINIDYTKTINELIKDGKYNWVNSGVTAENFSISPEMTEKKEVSAKLFHFNRDISSEDVISEMDKVGYRPANLTELLSWGILFPELQKQFPIVALGAVWEKEEEEDDYISYVPYLSGHDSWREIYLHWLILKWSNRYRFLAVMKK